MRPGKNRENKLLEMFQALAIELRYRDGISNLLVAPYGGTSSATAQPPCAISKEPKISWAEAATLAVLLNNPTNISPAKTGAPRDKRDNCSGPA